MSDQPKPGEAVDAAGGPVIDPTKNVLDLVRAAIQRQDDLRAAYSEKWEAKFLAVQHEFDLIESRRIEQKTDTKVAVDAALSAAEKAVKEQAAASEKSILKSETAAADQSRQQTATFTASLKGVTDTLSDLKDRVGKIETQQQTKTETRDNSRSNIGMIVGIFGGIYAVIMTVVVVATFIAKGVGS